MARGVSRDSPHENKMTELRKMFRLREFSNQFIEKVTNEDFERVRTKARETLDLPADDFPPKISAYLLYLKDARQEGLWTSFQDVASEVVDLWKQLPEDKKLQYNERAEQLRNRQKQQMADFKKHKLSQLLSYPERFYWLLSVSFNLHQSYQSKMYHIQVWEAKQFLPKEELDRHVQICKAKRLEVEIKCFSDFEVL